MTRPKIYICTGSKDDTETCSYFAMDPGTCPKHGGKLKPKILGPDEKIWEWDINQQEEDGV